MSNQSISSRIQWNISDKQYSSDTDSTLSDLEELSQSLLDDNYRPTQSKKENDVKDFSKVKTDSVQEVNKNIVFKEVTNRFNDNFQSKGSEISLQRTFENDTCLTEIVGKIWSEEINEKCVGEDINEFEHLQNICYDKSNNDSLPFKVLEDNTVNLTEIFGEVWNKEHNQNDQCLQKETNKYGDNVQKHIYNKSNDMGITSHTNFEINTCLTDIIGRRWSEEMNENEQCNERKTNKEEICSKVGKADITQSLQNDSKVEFSLTKIVAEKLNEKLKTDETSVYVNTPCEFTQKFVENVNSLLFDTEDDVDEEIELKNKSEVYNKECDVLKENIQIPMNQSNININSENLFDKILVNSSSTMFNQKKSNLIDQEINHEMDVISQVFDSSLLPDDNIQNDLSENNDTYLEGLTLNLETIIAEDISYGNNVLSSPLKNQSYRNTLPVHKPCNDRISNFQMKGINRFPKRILKPKVFPEPLNSKIRGIPRRDPLPKRSCTLNKKQNVVMKRLNKFPKTILKPKVFPEPLNSKMCGIPLRDPVPKRSTFNKTQNVITKEITKHRVIDQDVLPTKKKKIELISTSKTSFKRSECKKIKPENNEANSNQLKLKECTLKGIKKNAKVLLAIGTRLDEIKVCISKWLSGDPGTAVDRIDAINMLYYVRTVQRDIKTMYTRKKPAPVKKLIDAAIILELQIGKAISDADLLYKTEELNRLQELTHGNEDESDSDLTSTTTSSFIINDCHSTHKVEVEKNIQQSKYQYEEIYDEHNITETLTELSLQNTPLQINNLQIVNPNLKPILRSKFDHENDCFQKKHLNFSNEVEYFEISQSPINNIEETINAMELDESITKYNTKIKAKTSINNKTEKSTISLDEDVEMLEEEEKGIKQYKSDENNVKCMNSVLLEDNDNSLVESSSNVNQNNSIFSQKTNYSGNKHTGTFSFRSQPKDSGISEITQNKSSLVNANYLSGNTVTNSLEQSMNSEISNVNRNNTSILKKMHISKARLKKSKGYSSKPESVISGNILNQNKSAVETHNNFSSDKAENTEKYSSKLEPIISENILNQNKSPVAQQNYFPSNKLENTKSYSSKPESISSGTDVNTSSSDFAVPQQMSYDDSLKISFSKFSLSEIDENWYKISIMGVKDVRIKSDLEYYSSADIDNDDWFSDWS